MLNDSVKANSKCAVRRYGKLEKSTQEAPTCVCIVRDKFLLAVLALLLQVLGKVEPECFIK